MRGVEMAVGKPRARRMALQFTGAVHAVDVALYTERGDSVLQVARLEMREAAMSNRETRCGRIEVEASLQVSIAAAARWPLLARAMLGAGRCACR